MYVIIIYLALCQGFMLKQLLRKLIFTFNLILILIFFFFLHLQNVIFLLGKHQWKMQQRYTIYQKKMILGPFIVLQQC